ncbi:hypothetical protein [Candidatus Accumulibacter vicinus]|uniref:5-bromo-4-chloroindolyl phosphate hydrolysis protein n=1 Tax=Candidatus Accumulibacter vicinus TaxID=2954382 RepID=A0A084Y4H1_9PROT|nr:hypothetical protein [Candidatus Accumulibacter vicinus]KFB69615.1 MAG: hypothetical protein CAPSK01_000674 [Candidatus Accumulibacter vicinus]
MTDPRGRDRWVAGELPARALPRRRQSPPLPSTRLIERLERANRKHLVGRPLTAALRAGAGKPGEPPPLVLLMLIGGIGLLVSALFASATIVLAAAGVVALAAAAALWWRHRAASRYDSLTQLGYAGELQRDAECFDDYLEEVSRHLPQAALTTLARTKETLARVIAALAAADLAIEETFFVREMVARYLPDACRHYVEATAASGGCVVLEDGSTAEQSLCRQLDMLHARLEKTLARIADGRAQALARHETFVRSKE